MIWPRFQRALVMQEAGDKHDTRRNDSESPGSTPLTVLLPVHNEASTIEHVISDIYRQVVRPTGAELIVCEDGSTDGTLDVLQRLSTKFPFRLLSDSYRKGYANAVRDGLSRVRSDFAFFSDSDGQYRSADFWRLWPYAGEYDMVIGRKVRREEPFHRTALSRGFHVLAKSLFDIPHKDIDCGFRIINRRVLDEVLPEVGLLPYSFWAEFTIIAHDSGFKILEVPISHSSRLQGMTSIYTLDRLPKIVTRQLIGLAALRHHRGQRTGKR